MKPTLDQARKLLELISESGRNSQWVQDELIGSGAFSDLLEVDNLRDQSRDERRKFYGLPPLLASPCPPKKVLRRQGDIAIPAETQLFDPASFYQTRKGLFVWREFHERILAVAHPIEVTPAATIVSFDLVKPANDAEIGRELPEGYVFEDPSVFSAHLAWMITRQPNGKAGDLLTNGHTNLLYVRGHGGGVFAVLVEWDSGDRSWHMSAYQLDVDRWDAGSRVFSRNCPTLNT